MLGFDAVIGCTKSLAVWNTSKLRDLIAKMGGKSSSKFLADFLFSSPEWGTYLRVLETI